MKVCPIVNVGMHLKDCPPMLLTLYVVPTICEPLVGQAITACIERNSKLMGLDLADYSDGATSLHVDLLIGSDYYWDPVTGSVCRGGTNCRSHKVGLGAVRPIVHPGLCTVLDEPDHHICASS